MRIAIVSDIHGNGTAFEAVVADLRQTAPDLILHGGDLADGGSSPVEIVDRIRDLGWPGVVGNTDELLFRPESLTEFSATVPAMQAIVPAIEAMATWTREALGNARVDWLRALPPMQRRDGLALVHASPGNLWRAPAPEASNDELSSIYQPLESPLAIYGHIHRPYIRNLGTLTIANSGSAGLSYDGDRRASYLLLDNGAPTIRRVEYDFDRELKALAACGIPYAGWVAKMIDAARPQMP
ncbi:MAG: metallophosphoesterase [Candidatus Solibacter sp.]|nr:metallophosphoesterase [Candidatus Solibacter sp.]